MKWVLKLFLTKHPVSCHSVTENLKISKQNVVRYTSNEEFNWASCLGHCGDIQVSYLSRKPHAWKSTDQISQHNGQQQDIGDKRNLSSAIPWIWWMILQQILLYVINIHKSYCSEAVPRIKWICNIAWSLNSTDLYIETHWLQKQRFANQTLAYWLLCLKGDTKYADYFFKKTTKLSDWFCSIDFVINVIPRVIATCHKLCQNRFSIVFHSPL